MKRGMSLLALVVGLTTILAAVKLVMAAYCSYGLESDGSCFVDQECPKCYDYVGDPPSVVPPAVWVEPMDVWVDVLTDGNQRYDYSDTVHCYDWGWCDEGEPLDPGDCSLLVGCRAERRRARSGLYPVG